MRRHLRVALFFVPAPTADLAGKKDNCYARASMTSLSGKSAATPPVLVVFTTPRSGSNYLGSLILQSWQFGWMGEWLNPVYEKKERRIREWPSTLDLGAYLSRIARHRASPNGGWSIKLMPAHWKRLEYHYRQNSPDKQIAHQCFKAFFPNAIPVYLYREDIV